MFKYRVAANAMKRSSFLALACAIAVSALSAAYAGNPKEAAITEPLFLVATSKGGSSKSAASMARVPGADERIEKRESPLGLVGLPVNPPGNTAPDPVLNSNPVPVQVSDGLAPGFEGIGINSGFGVNSLPPDTTGAAGDTQYVQYVNSVYAVFDKSGTMCGTFNPANNTCSGTKKFFKLSDLFKSAGNTTPCASRNDGDPVVLFDAISKRWVLSQFAIPNGKYYQCVAVSKTSDATGGYWVYAFPQPYFNDYPKMGVWPDGYYTTFNMFKGSGFKGGAVCVFEREKMLSGLAARQYCSSANNVQASLMPASLDGKSDDLKLQSDTSVALCSGPACPPSGMPNVIANINGSQLRMGRVAINWGTGAGSVTWPSILSGVNTYSAACGGGNCIPQAGNARQLTAMSDRLMFRLAYIKPCTSYSGASCSTFGDGHLLVNHAVTADPTNGTNSQSGIRWYAIKPSADATAFTIVSQSTYAPSDSAYRSMGSIAADRSGNVVLGFSKSSSTTYPSLTVAYGATLASTGFTNEIVARVGSGAQTSYSRWGDYSHLSVDPVDGCTMWYTTEYISSDGNFNWSTFIYPYKVASCR